MWIVFGRENLKVNLNTTLNHNQYSGTGNNTFNNKSSLNQDVCKDEKKYSMIRFFLSGTSYHQRKCHPQSNWYDTFNCVEGFNRDLLVFAVMTCIILAGCVFSGLKLI